MAFIMMIASPLGGRLIGRVQPRYIIMASTGVAAVGIYLFSRFLDPRSTAIDVIIPLSIMAFGMGFGMSQRTSLIAVAVPQKEIGSASSILALARNIAGALGIAVFSTILTKVTESKVLEIARQSTVNATNSATYQQFIGLITLKAQIMAYHTVFVVSSIIIFIGALTAFFIRIHKDELVTDAEIFVE
jgi:MFS family permease